jgi:uncharacterized protein (TIGR02996 family)
MNDYLAFLRSIDSDFEDQAPRLAFADWLEERGEKDRADGIRCLNDLWNRGIKSEPHITVGPNHFWPHCPSFVTWYNDRGFARTVGLGAQDFVYYGAHLFRYQPIARVELTDKSPWFHEEGVNGHHFSYAYHWFKHRTWSFGLANVVEMDDDGAVVPLVLWEILLPKEGDWSCPRNEVNNIPYESAELAQTTLSAAGVVYGKRQAGWGK